jgi:Hemerythrin HHE cation binding domain
MSTFPPQASPSLSLVLAAHRALRRDLASFARISEYPAPLSAGQHEAVQQGWALFADQLRLHHEGEDLALCPRVRAHCSDNRDVLALLKAREDEHHHLDDLMTRAGDMLVTAPDVSSALRTGHRQAPHMKDVNRVRRAGRWPGGTSGASVAHLEPPT